MGSVPLVAWWSYLATRCREQAKLIRPVPPLKEDYRPPWPSAPRQQQTRMPARHTQFSSCRCLQQDPPMFLLLKELKQTSSAFEFI